MKIEIAAVSPTGLLSLKVSHGTEYCVWDAKTYAKTKEYTSAFDSEKVFEDINAFWASLNLDRQNAIWDVYSRIHDVFEKNTAVEAVHSKTVKLVRELYQLMPLDDVRHWVLFHSSIRFPTNLKEEFGPTDPHDRTYLRSDYVELAVLAVAVRPMVPIWGEYIARTNALFKELMAMSLLYNSDIVSCPAMERLRTFVESSVNSSIQKGPTGTAILGGLGSVELPENILALTVVRRLSIGEISPSDSSHLITNIYQFVSRAIPSMDRKWLSKFGGKVIEKNKPTGGSEEQKASIVEMYKVKQAVADGDIVIANVYTERVLDMAVHVEPELDLNHLTLCLEASKELEHLSIQPHHVTLVQWLLAKSLPTRSIPLLNKAAILRAMAVAQATLWQWEFYDLAVLVTATPLSSGRDEMIAALESRGRIPKELMAELQVLYPHHQPPRGKQQTLRQYNVATRAIDALCELITKNDWQLHAPSDLLQLSSRVDNTRKMMVPTDIRTHLARLIIKLAT